jgi:hypothetical protein
VGVFHVEHEADVCQALLGVAVGHVVQHQHVDRVMSLTPAAAMQRIIQRAKACHAMIRPNSNSDTWGDFAETRCCEETMGPLSPM